MIYLVSYDLSSAENPDYDGVRSALEGCGSVNAFQKSVCLVDSSLTPGAIREAVKPSLNANDTLFVAAIDTVRWCGWRTRLAAWISDHRGSGLEEV